MLPLLRAGAILMLISLASACGRMEQSSRARPGDGAVIYQSTILTMDARRPSAEAVIVEAGVIVDLGAIDDLVQAYPGAAFDERFLRRTLMPALVDVRLPANALGVLEIPCQGNLLTEDVISAGAGGASVRVVANGRTALSSAVDALRRLPDGAAVGRISVEARGPIGADAARTLAALDIALILSGDRAPDNCDPAAAPKQAAEPADLTVSGRIAIAPAAGSDALLAEAGKYLLEGGYLRLSPKEALEAIAADAAYALGDEAERGMIAEGRRADFAVLDRNPLTTPGAAWGEIRIESFSAAQ